MTVTLLDFLRDCYFLERDIRPETRAFITMKVGIFGCFLQRMPTIGDLNSDSINRFLAHRLECRSRETVRGERAVLRALWQQAYDSSLVETQPGRIRKMKRILPVVEAWDGSEIRKLLDECEKLEGRLKGRFISRRDYWTAVVRVLYSTGLRPGDLLALRWDDVPGPGPITVIQRKTQKAVTTPIIPEAWEALQRIRKPERRLIFGVICRRSYFVGFRKLAEAAGLKGRSKMLRRSSGSTVEHLHPGEGHRHLGHGRDVFLRHYQANRIATPDVREPPPIG